MEDHTTAAATGQPVDVTLDGKTYRWSGLCLPDLGELRSVALRRVDRDIKQSLAEYGSVLTADERAALLKQRREVSNNVVGLMGLDRLIDELRKRMADAQDKPAGMMDHMGWMVESLIQYSEIIAYVAYLSLRKLQPDLSEADCRQLVTFANIMPMLEAITAANGAPAEAGNFFAQAKAEATGQS